jgi:aspartate oxidase
MKPKLFLGILLISTILYQLFYQNIKEGVCNYNDDTVVDSNGNIVKRSSVSCQEAGIYTNNNNLKEVEEKLNELKTIARNTSKNIKNNSKSINKNRQNANRLGNAVAADDKEEAEEGGHCEKYPNACKDQQPYPRGPSASKVKSIMN